MKTLPITAKKRVKEGKKSARKLIMEGLIPSVLYGGQGKNHVSIPLAIDAIDILPLNYEPYFIELKLGEEVYRCILQAKQLHPVSDIPIHLDFLRVFEDQPTTMDIPLVLIGKSKGQQLGGVLIKKLRKLKIRALPKNMPNKVCFDVTNLDLGHTAKVREIATENFAILNPPSVPAVAVEIPRSLRSKASQQEGAVAKA